MFLDDMPANIARPDGWRATIDSSTRLLRNALGYADRKNLTAAYFDFDASDDTGGFIVPFTDIINIAHDADTPFITMLHRAAHEVKHHAQVDAAPLLFGWHALQNDLNASLHSQSNMFAQQYNLPYPPHGVLAQLVAEIDTMAFGIMAEVEANIAFKTGKIKADSFEQKLIDELVNDIIGNQPFIANKIEAELDYLNEVTGKMIGFGLQEPPLPRIQWVDIPPSLYRAATRGLWPGGDDAGAYVSAFDRPGGLARIKKLRANVQAAPEMESFTAFLSHHMRALPGRARISPPGLGNS